MNWHRIYKSKFGYTRVIGPSKNGLKLITLGMLRLKSGKTYTGNTQNKEAAFIIVSGTCNVNADDYKCKRIGRRKDLFSGKATSIYMPPNTDYTIQAVTDLEMAVGAVPTNKGGEVTLVRPKDTIPAVYGKGCTRRRVNFLIYDQVKAARLIVGETYHSSGGWSGYPPHKHDKDKLPIESANEEVYLIKSEPADGFGFATVYNRKNVDESYRVQNNSIVGIPYGYHPMVSAPGYKFGFIWFMAGKKRPWKPQYDPDHKWAIHLGLKMK